MNQELNIRHVKPTGQWQGRGGERKEKKAKKEIEDQTDSYKNTYN